jgi:hypothetical protein
MNSQHRNGKRLNERDSTGKQKIYQDHNRYPISETEFWMLLKLVKWKANNKKEKLLEQKKISHQKKKNPLKYGSRNCSLLTWHKIKGLQNTYYISIN